MQCAVRQQFYETATSTSIFLFLKNHNHENYTISTKSSWAILFYVFVTMDNLFILKLQNLLEVFIQAEHIVDVFKR